MHNVIIMKHAASQNIRAKAVVRQHFSKLQDASKMRYLVDKLIDSVYMLRQSMRHGMATIFNH